MANITLGTLRDYWKRVYDWIGAGLKPVVGIDQTTPGTTNRVDIGAALPAGTALLGKLGIDQATANANEVVVKSGTLTAVTAITNPLPAGTNAIGKLAANSGVDIGDVDIASITAGANVIGKVGIDQTTSGTTNAVAIVSDLTITKDAQLRAIDNIVDNIGAENIKMFLPMWEASGTTLYDLLRRDLKFTVNGATLAQAGPFGNCPSFDGTNDYVQQDPVTDLSATTTTATQELQAATAIAVQKMKVAATNPGFVRLRLIKEGAPDGNVQVQIRTAKDSAAITNGTSVALECSAVGVTAEWRGFTFATAPSLAKGTTYWLALVYSGNTNASADINIGWQYDAAGGYAQGRHYYDGAAWTDTAGEDHGFDVYSNALVLPDDFTIFLPAWLNTQTATTRCLLYIGGMLGGTLGMGTDVSGTHFAQVSDGTLRSASAYRWPYQAWTVWAMQFSKALDTAKLKLYKDGVLIAQANGTAATAHVALAQPWTFGAFINAVGVTTGFWTGRMAPSIMCSTLPTAANMAKISHNLLVIRKLQEAV